MRKSNDKSAKNSGNRTSGEGIAADHSKKNTSKAAVNKVRQCYHNRNYQPHVII